MITFENYIIFNEALKNNDVLLALLENPDLEQQLGPQLNTQCAQNLAQQAALKAQTLSDLIQNNKNELLQALKPFSHILIVKKLITAIQNEQ